MPRPLRVQYVNAWYHVMNRGAGRKKIFHNKIHRLIFLDVLAECHKMFNINIHAYCLMDNHYHLLISTPDANLSRAMRHLNGVYTQRYNRLLKTDGPLFRGRYKAQLIAEDCYLLIVSRYIHLNPIKAKLVDKPADYKWSSYPAYLGIINPPSWLCIDKILPLIKNYKDYVEDKNLEEIKNFIRKKLTMPILGTTKFKEKILSEISPLIAIDCSPDINRIKKDLPKLELIIQQICEYYRINNDSLLQTKKGTLNWPRLVFMYISRKYYGYSLIDISQSLGCIYRSTVSAGIHKCQHRLLNQPKLSNEIVAIHHSIKNFV
jgi:putative transposase